jgi:ABC-type lipoprotein release transport system permease subunit
MADDTQTAPAPGPARAPVLTYSAVFVGLRYLVRKKLSYLAVFGIALSVGTIIVVMSVFTGFNLKLTAVIRGYLSDMVVQPASAGLHTHSLRDWELFRQKVLEQQHVVGAAPFVQSVALMRLPGSDYMSYVFLRGVDPELEPTVTDLAQYMRVGRPADLGKAYVNPEGGQLHACFVGKELPGFTPELIRQGAGQLILVTATSTLDKRLRKYVANGLFETGNYEYDSQMVILNLDAAMDLVGSEGAVTGLSVRLDDYQNAEKVRQGLLNSLGWGAPLRAFPEGSAPLLGCALSGDGSRAAVLTDTGEGIVWAATADQPLMRLPSGQSGPTAMALDYSGERLAIARHDGSAAVYGVGREEGPLNLSPSADAVTAIAFAPGGTLAAFGHESGRVALFDLETGQTAATLTRHASRANALAFDGSGERLLSLSSDGTGCIWDTATGKQLATLEARHTEGGQAPMTAGTFSRDGRLVLTGDASGRATLWDAATSQALLTWNASASEVLGVGFCEFPQHVAVAAADGLGIWVYQVTGPVKEATRRALLPAEGGRCTHAALAADSTRILIVSGGRARLHYGGTGFHATTWEEQRKTFVEAVAMERFLMALILSLILIVAEFFIFAIVTTMVNERRRDIGILKAIGFTQGQICLAFLVVGLTIGIVAAALGVAGGLAFADHINEIRALLKAAVGFDPFPPDIYYFKQIPTHVGATSVMVTAGGAVLCSLLFSIFPALKAARMDPVQTLHYE